MHEGLRKKYYSLINPLFLNGLHYQFAPNKTKAPYGTFFSVTNPEANSDNKIESEEDYTQFSVFSETPSEAAIITKGIRDVIESADFSDTENAIVHDVRFQFSRDMPYDEKEKLYHIMTQFKAVLTIL